MWGPHDRISVLRRRDAGEFALSLSPTPTPPSWKSVRKRLSASQKENLTRTQPCWHPDCRLLACRTVRKQLSAFKALMLQNFVMAIQAKTTVTLTVLRRTDQVFCRMSLNLDFSDVFLRIRWRYMFGGARPQR